MKTMTTLTDENTRLAAELAASHAQVLALKQQLAWFKRQLFGRKSEKVIHDTSTQGQLFTLPSPAPSSPSHDKPVKAHTRRLKQKREEEVNDTGLRFTDDVPQQVIDLPCPELNGANAQDYEVIGTKDTYRLAQQVGSYVVLVYRRQVVKQKSTQTLTQAPAPSNVLEGCYADVSLLAGLMVDKAVYHLPLNRQHQRMLDAGVTLSRATLINYVSKGIELLRPIVNAMRKHMLRQHTLAMDEVPIKAGRTPISTQRHRQMKQTYFWPIYGLDDEVVFTWSRGRDTQHAINQLHGFNGVLLTDGYGVYPRAIQQLSQQGQVITHATCWAHCRRTFEKAQDHAPEETRWALATIRQLYQVEKALRDTNADESTILIHRQQHSLPIVQRFFSWLDQQRQRIDLLPKDPFTKALLYAHERREALQVYLTHASVPIDTNHLERALRVVPMGRKNHLFCWTELGAEQLGLLHSLMATCRLQRINPYHYLVDVLQRVAQHPASQVMDLTPRRWKVLFADNPLTSDVKYTPRHESAA